MPCVRACTVMTPLSVPKARARLERSRSLAPRSGRSVNFAVPSRTPLASGAGDKPVIAPKSLAGKFTWSGRNLKFERHYYDAQTKSYVTLPPGTVDIGAFCQATGTGFNACCWPYVATMLPQSLANNNHPKHCKNLTAAR